MCRFGENVKGCLDPSGGVIRADKALRAIQVISGQTRLLEQYSISEQTRLLGPYRSYQSRQGSYGHTGYIRADKALRAIQVISGQTRLLGKYRSYLSRQVS